MRLPPVGILPGMLRLCARIDARRPASWIALASGAWTAWWTATSIEAARTGGGMPLLSAALAATAAIGDLPLDLCPPVGRVSGGGRTACRPCFWAGTWACERALWPLAGLFLGAVAAGWNPACFGSVAGGFVGLPLAVGMMLVGRFLGVTAADAASLTIVVATASAAACFAATAWGEFFGLGCGVAAWLALGGLAWAWSRTSAAVATASGRADRADRGGGDGLPAYPLPSNSPLRRILIRLAMITALLAMAGWLGVANVDMAGWGQGGHGGRNGHAEQVGHATAAWALLSAAWFIGLAVPQATLLNGIAGGGGWERLCRTAARTSRADGGSPLERRGRATLPLGRVRFAGGVALTQAAILGWPAFLCAVLSLPAPARSVLPLALVIGLLAAAGLLVTAVAVGGAVGASRETVFAAVLAGVVAAGPAVLASFPDSPGSVMTVVVPAKWGVSSRRQGPDLRNFAGCVEESCPEER